MGISKIKILLSLYFSANSFRDERNHLNQVSSIEMVKKNLLCRVWTFFRFNFWYESCYLSLRDDLNGVWNLLYRLIEVEVFLIFHVEMENQKVVRLTTWVVESNSC